MKGYYRLIDQPPDSEVTPQNILRPHRARTLRRMQAQPTVLCIQDATDVNFTTHPQTTGLGVIGRNQTGAQSRGLHLHSTLALSAEGLPLGVLRAQFEAPPPKGDKAKAAREETKSFRWIEGFRDCVALAQQLPKTRVVSVCDREADLYDLFVEHHQHPEVELVVLAKHNRRLSKSKDEDDQAQRRLFDAVRNSEIRGQILVTAGRQSARSKSSKRQARIGRKQRSAAELALRYRRAKITSQAPEHRERPELAVSVIHACEHSPPPGEKPLEWVLLTTLAVDSNEHAEQVLRWYCLRWRIEDWHRVLKSGCRVEQRAHDSAERLERAAAIRMVIAWRVMLMNLLGREAPELPPEFCCSPRSSSRC